MPVLGRAKRRLGRRLGSPGWRAWRGNGPCDEITC